MNHGQIIDLLGGTAAVARRVSVRPASVSEWRSKGLPDGRLIELAAEIEDKGGPRRWDLRPDDWHRIWPELIGAAGAPAAPAQTPVPGRCANCGDGCAAPAVYCDEDCREDHERRRRAQRMGP